MRYEHLGEIQGLLDKKLITRRKHPYLPLWIHNYTVGAQGLPIKEWPEALKDCRGLILDESGEVIGRPFRKFWNYEQVLDQIPSGPFTVWEKLDGSLGIVCNYRGNLVVATRGSFESEQAQFAWEWLKNELDFDFLPIEGLTYLFEILYPENRIVVDYGDTQELRLLAVMEADGTESLATFYAERFPKARSFSPGKVFNKDGTLALFETPGEEGFVVRWANGFRAKVKFEEYKRLHRLITQVSTRTIWEMLRAGEHEKIKELTDRVPENFREWVSGQVLFLNTAWQSIWDTAHFDYVKRPVLYSRKNFAKWALKQQYPHVLFAIEDDKPVVDMIWKMVEPEWATPFKREVE